MRRRPVRRNPMVAVVGNPPKPARGGLYFTGPSVTIAPFHPVQKLSVDLVGAGWLPQGAVRTPELKAQGDMPKALRSNPSLKTWQILEKGSGNVVGLAVAKTAREAVREIAGRHGLDPKALRAKRLDETSEAARSQTFLFGEDPTQAWAKEERERKTGQQELFNPPVTTVSNVFTGELRGYRAPPHHALRGASGGHPVQLGGAFMRSGPWVARVAPNPPVHFPVDLSTAWANRTLDAIIGLAMPRGLRGHQSGDLARINSAWWAENARVARGAKLDAAMREYERWKVAMRRLGLERPDAYSMDYPRHGPAVSGSWFIFDRAKAYDLIWAVLGDPHPAGRGRTMQLLRSGLGRAEERDIYGPAEVSYTRRRHGPGASRHVGAPGVADFSSAIYEAERWWDRPVSDRQQEYLRRVEVQARRGHPMAVAAMKRFERHVRERARAVREGREPPPFKIPEIGGHDPSAVPTDVRYASVAPGYTGTTATPAPGLAYTPATPAASRSVELSQALATGLAELRTRFGTWKALARALGVTQPYLSSIHKLRRRRISADLAAKIQALLEQHGMALGEAPKPRRRNRDHRWRKAPDVVEVPVEELQDHPGWKRAAKAYRRFHGTDPQRVLVYRVPDGSREVTQDPTLHVGLGKRIQTIYHTPKEQQSSKAGVVWYHDHAKKEQDQPTIILNPETGLTTDVGGIYLVDDWFYS